MTSMSIALTRRIFPEGLARLQALGPVRTNATDELLFGARLQAQLHDAQIALTTAGCRLDASVLKALPQLRLIANIAVGVNNIDLDAARSLGIRVTNTPDVLTEATADMGFALLLAVARQLPQSERWLRQGHWDRWALDQWLGADLHQTVLGIVGMGRIGQAIARRARGFGMQVHYHNRRELAPDLALGAVYHAHLDSLLQQADHLMLVLPYSAESHHLIGEAQLTLMKPTATLVNIARGGIVDDAALARALRASKLRGAALDVFENEPQVLPELLELPNLVATPHLGSATERTRRAMMDLAIDNVEAWVKGQELKTPVV